MVKGVVTTMIGFFTFGGVAVNMLTLSGVALNTMGGILYAYSKYCDQVNVKLQNEFIGNHVLEVKPDRLEDEVTHIDIEKGTKSHDHVT